MLWVLIRLLAPEPSAEAAVLSLARMLSGRLWLIWRSILGSGKDSSLWVESSGAEGNAGRSGAGVGEGLDPKKALKIEVLRPGGFRFTVERLAMGESAASSSSAMAGGALVSPVANDVNVLNSDVRLLVGVPNVLSCGLVSFLMTSGFSASGVLALLCPAYS